MSHCTDCNEILSNTVYVNQASEPFCQDCSGQNGCIEKMDSQCVVYHLDNPVKPNLISNLGLGNGATAEQIFEAISALVSNNINVDLQVVDTPSINLTNSGPANHILQADVKLSATAGNAMLVFNDGLYAPGPDGKVKVNATDSADYLINQVVGGTDGIISISPVVVSGQVKFQPSIDLPLLMSGLCGRGDFKACIETVIGEVGSTPLVANDSSTIDFTASGTLGHTLTGAVKISSTGGNQLSVVGTGLYVPATTFTLLASNGVNISGGTTVKLGVNPIIEHTVLDGNTFDFSFNPRRVFIGNLFATQSGAAVSAPAAAGTKLIVSDQKDVTAVGSSVILGLNRIVNATGISLTAGNTVTSVYGDLDLNLSGSMTVNNSNVYAANLGVLHLNIATTQTITVNAGAGARPRSVNALAGVPVLTPSVGATTGSITDVASVAAYGPQQQVGSFYNKITNFYGVLIHDTREQLVTDPTTITNSYGVYQAGPLDNNDFRGPVRYYNGLINASDSRIKDFQSNFTKGLTEVKQVVPIVYKYKPTFQATSANFVGVMAQTIELIFPEAVSQGNNLGFSDFRFYDSTPLLYALVNSIKTITGQTLAAYTTDPESSVYTGASGDGEAKLADLNSLRVAHENLRLAYDDLRAKLIAAGILV